MGALPVGELGRVVTAEEVRKRLREARRDLKKASEAAGDTLNTGASRARVTTAHARWRSAAAEWARVFDWATELGFKDLALEIGREVSHG
jgi:hypothetical protein